MKKQIVVVATIATLFFSACSPQQQENSISSNDIQATSVAAAFTIVAETQAAIPTNTLVPPTETLIPTVPPTETPQPTPTVDPALITPTVEPTFTLQPTPTQVDLSACNQILATWEGPSATLSPYYEYSPQSNKDKVVLSIWVMTDLGECGYLGDQSVGPVGQYSVLAFIDGEKSFKVHGSFRVTGGSWKIIIRNDTVRGMGSCYPHC